MPHEAVANAAEKLRHDYNTAIAAMFPSDQPLTGPADLAGMEQVALYADGNLDDASIIEELLIAQFHAFFIGDRNTQPPIVWRTNDDYGQLWNHAWVRSHENDMLTISKAAVLTGWSINRVRGLISRHAINEWPNPTPKHRVWGNRLVSRREVLARKASENNK